MLQDLERSRPMEIDPLVTVVQEMGRLTKPDARARQRAGAGRSARQDRRALATSALGNQGHRRSHDEVASLPSTRAE